MEDSGHYKALLVLFLAFFLLCLFPLHIKGNDTRSQYLIVPRIDEQIPFSEL